MIRVIPDEHLGQAGYAVQRPELFSDAMPLGATMSIEATLHFLHAS